MANETEVGSLAINLRIKLEALEKGLETAKKKLQTIEEENKKVEQSNKSLEGSYIAMSAVAVASLFKIAGVIKDATEEYKAYTQAMSSLQNVSEYTGESMQDFGNIMDKFGAYMTKSDIATTIKNFSLMGMSAKETEKMIEALTNSAIRNRNANYTVSEAVRVASEGYRQGLSTLSDSAGVTENLSVMLDNYAKSIGKTASQLTVAEQNQAYLNRTMYAAEPFAGAMEDYLDSLAGKQGQYSQAMRETQVAFSEALEPTMKSMLEGGAGILNFINSLISTNPTLTAGMAAFAVTLMAVTVAMIALSKAKKAYTTSTFGATVATQGFTAALKANPIFLIATTVATVISGISMLCSAIKENEEAQAKLNETTKRYKQIKEGTYEYTDENIQEVESDKLKIEEQIELLNKKIQKEQEMKKLSEEMEQYSAFGENADLNKWNELDKQWKQAEKEARNLEKQFKKNQETNGEFGDSLDKLNDKLNENNKYLEKSNVAKDITSLLDTESIRNKKKESAQAVETAKSYQKLFQIYQQGKKGTKEYENAVSELEKKFPEAVNANGIMAQDMKTLIDKMAQDSEISWDNTQVAIQERIKNITTVIANCNPEIDVNGTYAKSVADKIGVPTNEVIGTLQTALNLYNMLLNKDSTEVGGAKTTYTPPKTSKPSGSKSYQNKALDNYKKDIEYKKSLDQISLQQEIAMYETALRKYAKTTDEKRELRTKIYELNKELAQKEKEILEQQTEDYEAYIQEQKNLRGASYDVTEQTRDYNKIIQMHRNYLNEIMQDERLSLNERKEIYREELQTIRDYEQQKRDLRVEAIDNTVSHLTNAITKQLEEMQEKDKEFIDKQIEEIERLKEIRIDAINAEYDAKIEAIEKELEALDKAEQQKSREEEDAEYEKKKKRLEELAQYEHDAVTKANYQKELDKLLAEYQKTLDKRALEDKKEALNEQKDLLQKEQDDKTQAIEDEAEKQKEAYNKQLEDLENYYEKQIEMAQEKAESMLLNVEQNQDKILELLQKYGDKYEITGQSLGEKLAQGINEGLANKLENIIQRIQNTIDAGIENQLAKIAGSVYKYEAGAGKPQMANKTVNVYQTNNIEQNPELPSETYRKLNNVSQKLAEEFAGM